MKRYFVRNMIVAFGCLLPLIGESLPFTWIGGSSGSWTSAGNWSPTRLVPAITDVIQFNSGSTITVTNIPYVLDQTILQLKVSNSTTVNLQAGGSGCILYISGLLAAGDDLIVESGSSLNFNGSADPLRIDIASGATALISGNVNFTNNAHSITAQDADALIFASGSTFTQGSGCTTNGALGSADNSVVFQSGSTFEQLDGGSPFQSGPLVVFNSGSLYKYNNATSAPDFANRTYGNFEYNYTGSRTPTVSGTSSVDNLTINNGSLQLYSMDFHGNMTINTGGTLILNSGTNNFNGSSTQTISGAGTLTINSSAACVIGSQVVASRDITFGGSLTVNAGSTLSIEPAHGVTVGGATTLNDVECLILHSDATGSASFIDNGISGSGSSLVERFIGGWTDASHGWHFLSSPLSSQAIQTGFVPNPPGSGQDFYYWDEPTNYWINSKTEGGTWNSSFDANFVVGKGYLIAYSGDQTKAFSGSLNNADVAKSGMTNTETSYNRGWNLLGNPFPSALTWNDGNWALSNITGTAKIWHESNASYSDIAATGIIPSMQGFMVEVAAGTTGSLTVPKASRIHSTQSWYKNEPLNRLLLTVSDPVNQTAQECIIAFRDQASNVFNPDFDSHFLAGYAPQFYSWKGLHKLSTNVLSLSPVDIPLDFIKTSSNQFLLSASGISSFDNKITITLKDLKTNRIINLREDPDYSFAASDGDDPARFILSFKDATGVRENNGSDVFTVYSRDGLVYLANSPVIDPDGQAEVYTLTGQLVRRLPFNGSLVTGIDLKDQSNGLYLLRFCLGEKFYVAKVIIKNH